jgi:hypothetical protein
MRPQSNRSAVGQCKGRKSFRLALFSIASLGVAAIGHTTLISSFQAGTGGWHMGTLAVGKVIAGSQNQIIIPYRNSFGQWFLDAYKPDGTRLAGFPYAGGSEEINVSPTLYDLNGDGLDEIIFTRGASVIALRGDGSVMWSNAVTRLNYVPNSGYMTVTNGFYWSNGGAFISNLPSTAVFSSQVCSPIVADVNGDGTKKIVTAWKIDPDSTSDDQDFNPFINDIWGSGEWGTMGESWSGGVVFFNANNGAKDYVYHIHQLVESGVALGRAKGNNTLETYVLNDSDSVVCFDKTQPHGLYGSGTLYKQFGKNQRLLTGAYEQAVDVYTADIDGDGKPEVLVPMTHLNPLWQPNETILDDDGAILWREWQQAVNFPLDQWQNNACMIPCNPDHDNRADVLSYTHTFEINYRYWNGVELVSHTGWPKNFYPFLPTPPVVGDVDGDGQEEIIIGTYNPSSPTADGALYVYALDGTLKTSVVVLGGLKHIPTLADVNGDGALDVIFRSLAGRVYIYNFGATTTNKVSWSTHRGNKQRDGNYSASLYPPGTPIITNKQSGYRRASFSWAVGQASSLPSSWQIFRADNPNGPFTQIATLPANVTSYTNDFLTLGWQYIYEVAAVYPTNVVHSPPFAVLASLNKNLLANGGFEENDNSHWDKWWSGIDWTNMVATSNAPHGGHRAMEITLNTNSSDSTICQFNQYGTPDSTIPVTPGTLYSFGGFFKSSGLTQPSEHWLEWYSTKTAANTNDRPARPYPGYFTPHFYADTSASGWTYVNRTFVMPAGFSNIELAHRFSVAAPTSGKFCMDDLFFRALPSPSATNWIQLLPFGSAWKYSALAPPVNWFATNFNDAVWTSGFAKFGAGGGPLNIVTALPTFQTAYYFRTTFNVPNTALEELLLAATCTDGGTKSLEIYLNGTKLPTSGIEAVSAQGNSVQYYDLAPFIGMLHPGTNTIAVTLNNVWTSWDDVAFDVSLKAIPYTSTQTQEARINSISCGPGCSQMKLNISIPPNTAWRVESCDNACGPNWRLMEVVTNTSGGTIWVEDTGQNSRLLPAQTTARFYRLAPN